MKSILIRTFFLGLAVIVVCSCASTKPGDESAQVSANVGPAAAPENAAVEQTNVNPEIAQANLNLEEVTVEGEKEVHCTLRKKTGSNLRTRYCRTAWEDDRQREAGRAWIQSIQNKPQGGEPSG